MKKIFTVFCSCVLATSAHAQITFDANSFANLVVTSDTFGKISNSAPVLTTGANQQYNMLGLAYMSTKYYSEQLTGANPFASGNGFNEGRGYEHGTLKFDSKRWSAMTANGIERFGEEVPRQALSLVALGVPGAVSTDSLIILAQNAPYTVPYAIIKFPSTYQSTWNTDFSYTVNMELTFAGGGYNAAPMQLKVRTQYDFEIVGWGHAELALLDGTFGECDVLMERISATTIDSLFINGAPANGTVTGYFGFTQNRTSNLYFDELFRVNEVNALVLYNYGSDASFTNVADSRVHQLRVPFATSVPNVAPLTYNGEMNLYPNPVEKGETLNMYMPPALYAQTGAYKYTVCDIMGRTLASGTVQGGQRNTGFTLPVQIPGKLASGNYWLTVYDGNSKLAVTPFALAD